MSAISARMAGRVELAHGFGHAQQARIAHLQDFAYRHCASSVVWQLLQVCTESGPVSGCFMPIAVVAFR
jgi:hypothetical protein